MFKLKKGFLFVLIGMVALLVACGGNNGDSGNNNDSGDSDEAESGKVVVTGKDYTEQIILTHIYGEYLKENTDLEIEVEDNLGSVFVIHEAMKKGDVDLYVEYTGTGYLNVLDNDYEPGMGADQLYEDTKEGYLDEFNFKWLTPTGHNNQYALTLTDETIEEMGNITTSSELVEHAADLTFGSNAEFYERGDGYDALIEAYDFEFGETTTLDEDLTYSAIKNDEIDVATGYTTDPRIEEFNLITLEDDLEFFPPYDSVPVIPVEVLEANPGLEDTINELAESGIFTNENIMELNGRVSTDGEKEVDVARDFLQEHGMID